MNEKIKNAFQRYPYVCIIFVAVLCFGILWYFINNGSRIDTTGIRNAETELKRAGEYQQQSVEYNHEIRNAITDSVTLNERATNAVSRGQDFTNRTAQAITDSQSEVKRARENAERADDIISESRSILERAEARNQKSAIPTTAE